MTRRALVLSYSQTGQTRDAAAALVAPLQAQGWEVDWRLLEVAGGYPFPWSAGEFFDVFPETVLGLAPALKPLGLDGTRPPDLVVLASQVWYLAPSLPVQAFLASADGSLLRDTPVVSVVTCRNMWYAAVRRLHAALDAAGARRVATVVLTDLSPPLATFIMTPRWFLTGRSDPLWGLLPAPGVAPEAFTRAARVGEAIAERGPVPVDTADNWGGAEIEPDNLALDLFGSRVFRVWATIIHHASRFGRPARRAAILAWVAFLVSAIVVSLPVLALAKAFLGRSLRRAADNYALSLRRPVAV